MPPRLVLAAKFTVPAVVTAPVVERLPVTFKVAPALTRVRPVNVFTPDRVRLPAPPTIKDPDAEPSEITPPKPLLRLEAPPMVSVVPFKTTLPPVPFKEPSDWL